MKLTRAELPHAPCGLFRHVTFQDGHDEVGDHLGHVPAPFGDETALRRDKFPLERERFPGAGRLAADDPVDDRPRHLHPEDFFHRRGVTVKLMRDFKLRHVGRH